MKLFLKLAFFTLLLIGGTTSTGYSQSSGTKAKTTKTKSKKSKAKKGTKKAKKK